MNVQILCRRLAAAIAMLCIAGCGGLSKPYPDKSLHAIVVGEASPSSQQPVNAVLRIDNVRVAEPFDATTFYYKTGETRFESDYYNGFIAPPGRLLTGALGGYLASANAFSTVVGGSSAADNRFALETNITGIYGDFTAGQPTQAVVEARFFLIDESGGDYNVIFEKWYRQTSPLSGDAPQDLASAMGVAYQQMLAALVADLRPAAENYAAEKTPAR